MADGFLGRWSRRKLDANEGKPLAEPAPSELDAAAPQQAAAPAQPVAQPPAESPPLTMEDAQALTSDSDFRPFAARSVAPEVRNAALKKLFSDPHFNVMDRLDTYIDDYSLPDPMPAAMLRQLASAKFLGLFDQEEKEEREEAERARQAALAQDPAGPQQPVADAPDSAPREVADNPTNQTVAQSAAAPAVPSAHSNDDTDMRLQPDDASPGEKPGGSAE